MPESRAQSDTDAHREQQAAQLVSALRSGVQATENAASLDDGDYSDLTMADLISQGFEKSPQVSMTGTFEQGDYCLVVTHAATDETWFYDSNVGWPQTGTCSSPGGQPLGT